MNSSQELCQQCHQKHDCKRVYEHLGNQKGPSVAYKAVVAFLLPIVIFIASLAIFERILSKQVITKQLQTALGFIIAISITLVSVLIIRAINKISAKDK